MPIKHINLQISDTGLTVCARIQRESDSKWYKDSDGSFTAYDQSNVVVLTEDAQVKRKYSWSGGDSVVWPDGRYYVYAFKQVGGSPDDDNDEPVGDGVVAISDDEEVTNDVLDDGLTLIKGLLGINCVLDDFTYDGNGKATAGNMYIYDGPGRIATHESPAGGPGLLKKIIGTAVITGGNTTKLTRTEA